MRLTWLTDTHLQFCCKKDQEIFADHVANQKPDHVIITGDIADANSIKSTLITLQERVGVPIFYVLGNHDFYNGSIKEVRKWATHNTITSGGKIFWMHGSFVKAKGNAALVGVDGMADGLLGDGKGSQIVLNDWRYIKEMSDRGMIYDRAARLEYLKKLGEEEAKTLALPLTQALAQRSHVYILTHVPPWKEATWHEGEHSEDNWLPWFSCKAVGEMIEKKSSEYPGKKITVLCGHTHSSGHSQITDDIEVYTGAAEYYVPEVQMTLDIQDDGSYKREKAIGTCWDE